MGEGVSFVSKVVEVDYGARGGEGKKGFFVRLTLGLGVLDGEDAADGAGDDGDDDDGD